MSRHMNHPDDEIPTIEQKNHEWAALRQMSQGYATESNTQRGERLDAEKAGLWSPAAAAELEAIERAEREGLTLSNTLRTKAGLLQEAKTAHERVAERVAAAASPERLRDTVAAEKGVPAAVLRGSTREELEAHADAVKPLMTPAKSGAPTPYKAPDREPRSALHAAYATDKTN
jgi:hypothetical protein